MGGSPRPCVGAPQSGFTLVEILITLVLAGLVVLGIATGLLTLVRSNAATDERQRIDQALGNMSEGVKALVYDDCVAGAEPTAASYQSAYDGASSSWLPPTGMTARVTDVQFWNRTTQAFDDACPSGDQGAQKVTIEVTWRNRNGTAELVKGER